MGDAVPRHDTVRRATSRGVMITVTGAALMACGDTTPFNQATGSHGDPAASGRARDVLTRGLGVGSFDQACGRVDWACPITDVVAESDYVVTIRASVHDKRWEPAGRGARSILKYLRQASETSQVSTVKYANATGDVLDTADKFTSAIGGDCALPCGSPR